MSHKYEIEIKSLLGSKENADKLISNLKKSDRDLKLISEEKQLNHYFNFFKEVNLRKSIGNLILKENKGAFEKILDEGKNISVRTRDSNGKVLFVIKASIDSDSSSNGVRRIEFEQEVPIRISELDKLLIDAGLTYQAKWSREREQYSSKNTTICLDKNAGYGYLAEFERVISDESIVDQTRNEILDFMREMGVEELKQDRLERMFAHYNAHWRDYYGTNNIFNLD